MSTEVEKYEKALFDEREVAIDLDTRIYDYNGFDAKMIFETMAAREPKESQLFKDIETLCLIMLKRGANLSKIQLKTSEEGTKAVVNLIKKYNIAGINAKLGPKTITLGRILNVFPVRAAMVWKNPKCIPRTYTNISLEQMSKVKVWFMPALAALFPKHSIKLLSDLQLPFLLDTDRLINLGKSKSEREGSASKVRQYQTIQIDNSRGTDTDKEKALVGLGIGHPYKDETTGQVEFKITNYKDVLDVASQILTRLSMRGEVKAYTDKSNEEVISKLSEDFEALLKQSAD